MVLAQGKVLKNPTTSQVPGLVRSGCGRVRQEVPRQGQRSPASRRYLLLVLDVVRPSPSLSLGNTRSNQSRLLVKGLYAGPFRRLRQIQAYAGLDEGSHEPLVRSAQRIILQVEKPIGLIAARSVAQDEVINVRLAVWSTVPIGLKSCQWAGTS